MIYCFSHVSGQSLRNPWIPKTSHSNGQICIIFSSLHSDWCHKQLVWEVVYQVCVESVDDIQLALTPFGTIWIYCCGVSVIPVCWQLANGIYWILIAWTLRHLWFANYCENLTYSLIYLKVAWSGVLLSGKYSVWESGLSVVQTIDYV